MMALIEKGRSRFIGSAQSVLIDRVSETITGVTTFFVASCGYPQRVAPQRCPPQFHRSCLVVFNIPFLSPVRLHEHGVDLFQPDDPFLIPDGFEQGRNAEVAHTAQDAFG